jgi:hypothetical protein
MENHLQVSVYTEIHFPLYRIGPDIASKKDVGDDNY